jgi:hypothetical protein
VVTVHDPAQPQRSSLKLLVWEKSMAVCGRVSEKKGTVA